MTLLLLLLIRITIIDGRYFRNDYSYQPEVDGWLKLHQIPSNWHEARLRCHYEGAILVSPLNDKFAHDLAAVVRISGSKGIYTGISATYSKGDFYTIEGIPINELSIDWAPGQPDNFEDREQCTIFLGNKTMADVDCKETYTYMCYRGNSVNILTPQRCGSDPYYGYSELTSQCYKLHPEGQTWSRAFMICSAERGHLAIINSREEASIIFNLFVRNPPKSVKRNITDSCFLGFRAESDSRDWITVHGQILKEAGPDIWGNGRPHNESCGGFAKDGKFVDLKCEDRYAFICEKLPETLQLG